MIDDHEHPADAPEQEITSETPEFAAELAARTIEPSAMRDEAEKQTTVDSSSVTETGSETGSDTGKEAGPAEAEPEDSTEAPQPNLERLQKILAQAGVASRRHAEELITQGRVQVNGQIVTVLGTKADPRRDHIRVDGKLLHGAERLRYFVLNKPKGFVTTVTDPEGRPTVMQFFAKTGERLYPVGRLDYQSEGLLLVTNDGELANQLTRAASGVEKTYLVKVAGQPGEEQIDRLRGGVAIDKGGAREGKVHTAPARIRQVRQGDNPWYEVVLIEGRNRELRKMFEEIGHHVEKIRRVGYGPLVLDVEPGKIRELNADEVQALRLTAAGKLKPRRAKASLMLPKEAGQSTEQRMAKDAARREKKFKRPYPRDQRRNDFGARPPEGHAKSRPEFGPDSRRPSREDARQSPSRGGRFKGKHVFGDRPPRAERKSSGVQSQTGGKPRFDRRPPGSASGFRREPPQREAGRPSYRAGSNLPRSDRRHGFDSNQGRNRTGNRTDRQQEKGREPSRPAGVGGLARPGAARSRLEIRPVEPDRAFEREKPRIEKRAGPTSGPSRTRPRTDGPPRGRGSARPFRGAGPDRPQGTGASPARFKKKDGVSRPNRFGSKNSGSKRGGKHPGGKRMDGGKRK